MRFGEVDIRPDGDEAFVILSRCTSVNDEEEEAVDPDDAGFYDWQLSALRMALEADHEFGIDQIKVGTIHSAKGLEAPTCLLFGDVSAAVHDSYNTDPAVAAEEHRLYYVGAYEIDWWSPKPSNEWEPVKRGEFDDVEEPEDVSHLA